MKCDELEQSAKLREEQPQMSRSTSSLIQMEEILTFIQQSGQSGFSLCWRTYAKLYCDLIWSRGTITILLLKISSFSNYLELFYITAIDFYYFYAPQINILVSRSLYKIVIRDKQECYHKNMLTADHYVDRLTTELLIRQYKQVSESERSDTENIH